jgi:glutamyl-tRNA reductase
MPPALHEIIEHARCSELERALRLLQAGRDAAEVMEALPHRLTNKLLHGPTRALREGVTICTSTS